MHRNVDFVCTLVSSFVFCSIMALCGYANSCERGSSYFASDDFDAV